MNIKFISFGVLLYFLLGSAFSTAGCVEKDLFENSYEFNNSVSLQNTYSLIDTGQNSCYDNNVKISSPTEGDSFYGQDAQYYDTQPVYQDNGDGTVTDLNTGLMWQQSPDTNSNGIIDYDDKMTYDDALVGASSFKLAGYSDWRLPTIKELYSLIMFYGAEPNPSDAEPGSAVPFIDTDYFGFAYGDLSEERIIDAQYASSTIYVSTTMGGDKTMFGVNFADGRIKGYPAEGPMGKKYYVIYVRGNTNYGINQFVDNGDGTITDSATGLMWMENDNEVGVLWEDALSYAENLEYAGYNDWRLPNAKELQSIVDYTRSPDTTSAAAIDSLFDSTQIINEAGETDFPFYWSSTTFCSQSTANGKAAVYVSFGRAMGYMLEHGGWIDVHGAGAQRSDPKTGDPEDYPYGHGPQGDAIRIYNYVRCVRGGLSDDQAPEKPETPNGPSSGNSGIEYTYTTSTIDPNDDQIYYWFDWGDESNSSWLGPYNSGVLVSAKHIWEAKGNYVVKVKAKDVYGVESDWSDPLPITMPYTIKPSFQQFCDWLLQRFPHALLLLRHLMRY